MILYQLLPPEIVDMIYLRTNFFTAIKHIPENTNVLKKLFKRDSCSVSKNGNFFYPNKDYVSIYTILERECIRSLRFYKIMNKHVILRETMFQFNNFCRISIRCTRNMMLMKVFDISPQAIKKFERWHKIKHRIGGSYTI